MSCNRLETSPGVNVNPIALTVNGDGTARYNDGTVINVRPDIDSGYMEGVRIEVRSGQWLVFRRDRFFPSEVTKQMDIEEAGAARDRHRRRLHLRVRDRAITTTSTIGSEFNTIAKIPHMRSKRRGYHRR